MLPDLMVLDYTAALEVSAPRLPRLAQAAVAAWMQESWSCCAPTTLVPEQMAAFGMLFKNSKRWEKLQTERKTEKNSKRRLKLRTEFKTPNEEKNSKRMLKLRTEFKTPNEEKNSERNLKLRTEFKIPNGI